MIFGLFTLFVAITISAVAAYYSIVGLTAIFSAAVIPIIIMGAALEVGKVTAAVWLKMYWTRSSITYKLYLVPAVVVLMLITSMGIFGFLSKAHSDQSMISGDVQAKIAIYDEKIRTERENIDANRRALKQLDEAVDQVMGRSTDEKGAEKAVQIRRGQQAERGRLLREIEQSQKRIASLNEERAPIAAEVRKVEAEVGPIKYIAALVYGDNPDANLLEAAVRWVIIIIVAVFDPLALVLILAAQQSLRWAREDKEKHNYEADDGTLTDQQIQQIKDSTDPQASGWAYEDNKPDAWVADVGEKPTQQELEPELEKPLAEKYPYLFKPFTHFMNLKPMVTKTQPPVQEEPAIESEVSTQQTEPEPKAVTVNDNLQSVKKVGDEYYEVAGKKMHKKVFENDFPQLASAMKLHADNLDARAAKSSFGLQFPNSAVKGEMFLRVDQTPNKLFKFNGTKWIEVDKDRTDSYTYDRQYILFLIEKLKTGEYDIDQLSATEQELVAEEIKKQENDQT